jgi:hypothetical protein
MIKTIGELKKAIEQFDDHELLSVIMGDPKIICIVRNVDSVDKWNEGNSSGIRKGVSIQCEFEVDEQARSAAKCCREVIKGIKDKIKDYDK